MAAACEWRTRRRGKLGVVSAGAWHVSHLEKVSERMRKGRKLIKSGACWMNDLMFWGHGQSVFTFETGRMVEEKEKKRLCML